MTSSASRPLCCEGAVSDRKSGAQGLELGLGAWTGQDGMAVGIVGTEDTAWGGMKSEDRHKPPPSPEG